MAAANSLSGRGMALNALYQAGGPTERGDACSAGVPPRGAMLPPVDLYVYLLEGEMRDDIWLAQARTVQVPPRSQRYTIAGRFQRPAFYDLAEGEDLRKMIRNAGGLLPESHTGREDMRLSAGMALMPAEPGHEGPVVYFQRTCAEPGALG